MSTEQLAAIIERADSDATFRGTLIWFPEKLIEAYGLSEAEGRALRTGDMTSLEISDELRKTAERVFDLHDLHAGE